MIKYSIIIPHFNDEVGLSRLLESIPCRDDIQVVVVDDRSDTEDYKNVINESLLPYLVSYTNQGVKSAGTCRNLGVEKSVGKYLIFADSDDYFTADAFLHFDAAVASKNCDLYFFRVTSTDKRNNSANRNRHQVINTLVDSFLDNPTWENELKIRLTHFVPWGKVYRADFIKKNNILFDQTIVANDGIFSVTSGKLASEICVTNEVVYCSTIREKSLTTSKNKHNHRIRVAVYIKYYKMLTKDEINAIGTSPIPLIYTSLGYGGWEFLRTIYVFRLSGIPIFKNFMFKLQRFKLRS